MSAFTSMRGTVHNHPTLLHSKSQDVLLMCGCRRTTRLCICQRAQMSRAASMHGKGLCTNVVSPFLTYKPPVMYFPYWRLSPSRVGQSTVCRRGSHSEAVYGPYEQMAGRKYRSRVASMHAFLAILHFRLIPGWANIQDTDTRIHSTVSRELNKRTYRPHPNSHRHCLVQTLDLFPSHNHAPCA